MESNEDLLKYVYFLFTKLIDDGLKEINADPDRLRVAAPQYLIELFNRSLSAQWGYEPQSGTPIDFSHKGVLFVATYLNEAAVFDIDNYLYKDKNGVIKISFMPALFKEQGSYTEIVMNLSPLISEYFKQDDPGNN
jgi:hypothetical protein